ALVLVGGLGAWLVAQGSARAPWSGARATLVTTVEGEHASTSSTAATDTPARTSASSVAPTNGDGSGVLELEFVEPDGAPARNLDSVEWCERRANRVVGHGVSDERCRSLCAELPEDVFLIQTERRGGAAAGFRGVWLAHGETERVRIELPRGGTVTGRVVDDRGEPRAGIEVTVPGGPAAWRTVHGLDASAPTVVAVTGADGRFQVEHLRSFPHGVWIVEGAERPENTIEPSVLVREPRFCGLGAEGRSADVEEGGSVDVGDLELARGFDVAGRVLDAGGAPIEGALVSAHPTRAIEVGEEGPSKTPEFRPGANGFALRTCEVLTDALGAFALSRPSWSSVSRNEPLVVVTSDGRRETKDFVPPAPGGRIDGLQIVVANRSTVTLDVVDERGARVELPPVPSAWLRGRHQLASARRRFELVFGFADGTKQTELARKEPDGLVRRDVQGDLAAVRWIEVFAPGWKVRRIELPSGVPSGVPLRVELARSASVRVALQWKDGRPPDAITSVTAHACLLAELPTAPRRVITTCCGLGNTGEFLRADTAAPLELFVATDEPYYVHVTGAGPQSLLVPQRFGPFVPGEVVQVLELEARVAADESARVPSPPPSAPGAPGAPGELRLRVVDAVDGRELTGSLSARRPWTDDRRAWAKAGAGPARLPSGEWELTLSANDHRPLELGRRSFTAGTSVDLGTLALEPLPVRRGRFVHPDGTAACRDAFVSTGAARTRVDAEGRFTLRGEFDADVELHVMEARSEFQARTITRGADLRTAPVGQTVRFVKRWTAEEERVLPAPQFRDVLIRVFGIPEAHREGTLSVVLKTSAAMTEGFWAVGEWVRDVCEFRFRVAEGRWIAELACPLHPRPPIEFEVGEDLADGACVAEFRVR
ncbi:MAG: hypothetical protein HZA53_00490, partial [Planctomycetes bacterium]|nr:hypothetical protein [Planctomycetota bacterium]